MDMVANPVRQIRARNPIPQCFGTSFLKKSDFFVQILYHLISFIPANPSAIQA
jgi:hypothetical protein